MRFASGNVMYLIFPHDLTRTCDMTQCEEESHGKPTLAHIWWPKALRQWLSDDFNCQMTPLDREFKGDL